MISPPNRFARGLTSAPGQLLVSICTASLFIFVTIQFLGQENKCARAIDSERQDAVTGQYSRFRKIGRPTGQSGNEIRSLITESQGFEGHGFLKVG
jgi:hypothetical protein